MPVGMTPDQAVEFIFTNIRNHEQFRQLRADWLMEESDAIRRDVRFLALILAVGRYADRTADKNDLRFPIVQLGRRVDPNWPSDKF